MSQVLVMIDGTFHGFESYEELLIHLLKARRAGKRALVSVVDGEFPR